MEKKIVVFLMFAYVILNLNVTYASNWQANGKVYCDINFNGIIDPGDVPLRGVTVNILNEGGSFSITQETNKKGSFFIVLPSTPDTYRETLDEATLPIGSTFVIPSYNEHIFTLEDVISDWKEWLIESDYCTTTTTVPEKTTTTSVPSNEEFCGNDTLDHGEDCDPPGVCCGEDCTYYPKGTPCPDEIFCNGEETCDGVGTCNPGTPPDCDDDNLCTTDSCNPATGCQNNPVICPPGDECVAGECVTVAGCATNEDCYDGVACTVDICEQGTCLIIPEDESCDDDNLCTADSCDPSDGCLFAPIHCPPGEWCNPTDGQCMPLCGCISNDACQDGLYCNGIEICVDCWCFQGIPPDCDDGVDCTDDMCDTGLDDCLSIPNNSACDDGNLCTTDSCSPVTGCQNDPVICPSGQECVAGECVPGTDCITSDDCIDGIACTEDICEQGTCLNIPDDAFCDDGAYCNGEESCDSLNGCISTGDPCSTGTVCNEESNTCDPFVSSYAYSKDFLEQGNPGGWSGSLKTFDDEWTLSPGGTVDMDIWLNDLPEPMLTAGCYITFDPALITITNLVPNDTNNGGQWDGGATSFFEFEPGIRVLALADFGCAEPDADGDILLARVTFQRQAAGVVEVTIQTIPGFDTLVDCSGVNYDPLIPPNTIIINDGITASGCFGNFDNDSDVDGTDAGIFKLDFGRSTLSNPCEGDTPCNGDFDCDTDVDGNDAYEFKTEFGRCQFANPCPISAATVNCTY